MSLLGAAAVAASIVLVRQQRQIAPPEMPQVDTSEESPKRAISLERLRELGI